MSMMRSSEQLCKNKRFWAETKQLKWKFHVPEIPTHAPHPSKPIGWWKMVLK